MLNNDDICKKTIHGLNMWVFNQTFILLGDEQKKPSLEMCWWL
jgi:hypothetical protein